MKVFVLGRSGAGKTPMATHLARRVGLAHVRASAWARAAFPGPRPADDAGPEARAAFVEAITRWSTDELVRDPWVSIDAMVATGDLGSPCVIEGVRNPLDFVHLYDPRQDIVIWLEVEGAAQGTAFECGLDVIAAYLQWQLDAGLRDEATAPVWRYWLRGFRRTEPGAVSGATLDDAIDDAAARLIMRPAPVVRPRPPGQRVHAAIPPLAIEVRDEYLFGMDPSRVGGFTAGHAFALSSYPGEAPTFLVRLPDGAVFSYLPPVALVDRGQPAWGDGPALELRDLAYADCPDERVVVHVHAELGGELLAYLKHHDRWVPGRYHATIEWWTGNQVLHVVVLASGQVALLPHHKLKFGPGHGPGFAPYRKVRKTWRVD